jgi:isopentenyl diphosphate isomerase/L-lactate dehydrogenase-like FMN-dependent dehydrogenase
MLMIINYDGGIDNVKDLCDGADSFIVGRRFLKKMRKMKKHEGDFMDFIRKSMRSRCSVLFKLVNE